MNRVSGAATNAASGPTGATGAVGSVTDGTTTVASPSTIKVVGGTVEESPAGTAKVTAGVALWGPIRVNYNSANLNTTGFALMTLPANTSVVAIGGVVVTAFDVSPEMHFYGDAVGSGDNDLLNTGYVDLLSISAGTKILRWANVTDGNSFVAQSCTALAYVDNGLGPDTQGAVDIYFLLARAVAP